MELRAAVAGSAPCPWSQAEPARGSLQTVVLAGLDLKNALAAPLGAQGWFERAAGQLGVSSDTFHRGSL